MIPAVPVAVGVTAEGSACLGSANIRQRRAASRSMSFSSFSPVGTGTPQRAASMQLAQRQPKTMCLIDLAQTNKGSYRWLQPQSLGFHQ